MKSPIKPFMNYSLKKTFYLFLLSFLALTTHIVAKDTSAFSLSGHFDDVFAEQHQFAGTYAVHASGAVALVDMRFDYGYREYVGSDGDSTYVYVPFTGDRTGIPNPNSQATIAPGHFPKHAHFFTQVLWLVSTHNTEVISNLQTAVQPFYRGYEAQEIRVEIKTNVTSPYLIKSVEWYAPAKMANGTNRHDLPMYPNGWLLAEIEVVETQTIGTINLPQRIKYTQYITRPISAPAELHVLRNPRDVKTVEVAEFTITNAQIESPLSSYIPEIVDTNTVVTDARNGVLVRVASGKWWHERSAFLQNDKRVENHRYVLLCLLSLLALFPVYLVLKKGRHWGRS